MTRQEILDELAATRARLLDAIDGLEPEQLLAPATLGQWSIRDVLQHLTLWEAELVRLFAHLDRGNRPTGGSFVPNPDFDTLNARWHAETKDRPLDRVLDDLHGVRRQTVRWISEMNDDDLNRKRGEVWLRGEPLATWIADYSFEHEKEHTAQIWEYRKGIGTS
jgi:uncharacterized protein (TIGR03083 family)